MEQAIYGLLANAVDASPAKSTLRLETGSSRATSWLTIQDAGAGLSFTPAPRDMLPGPSTKSYGHGLGIPFAYKICDLHDGELNFAAANPTGTVATITLPVAPGSAASAAGRS